MFLLQKEVLSSLFLPFSIFSNGKKGRLQRGQVSEQQIVNFTLEGTLLIPNTQIQAYLHVFITYTQSLLTVLLYPWPRNKQFKTKPSEEEQSTF